MSESEPDLSEHERDKQSAGRPSGRERGTSVDAKLATWGDVPGQQDIFGELGEATS